MKTRHLNFHWFIIWQKKDSPDSMLQNAVTESVNPDSDTSVFEYSQCSTYSREIE